MTPPRDTLPDAVTKTCNDINPVLAQSQKPSQLPIGEVLGQYPKGLMVEAEQSVRFRRPGPTLIAAFDALFVAHDTASAERQRVIRQCQEEIDRGIEKLAALVARWR